MNKDKGTPQYDLFDQPPIPEVVSSQPQEVALAPITEWDEAKHKLDSLKPSELEELVAMQGLLKVFGHMNKEDALQNNAEDPLGRIALARIHHGDKNVDERYKKSVNVIVPSLINDGKGFVGEILGIEKQVKTDGLDPKEAEKIVANTFFEFKNIYQGTEAEKQKLKKSKLAKVNRKLTKLQKAS